MSTEIIRNFSGGELGPELHSRVDLIKYATGLKTCRNMQVMRSGGAQNRPGTEFVAEVKSSATGVVRLIPWVYNDAQTYILEFGNEYIRFHQNGAQILEAAQNITGFTLANPCTFTIAAHGYSNGEEVVLEDCAAELDGRNFKVANAATNTFTLTYMDGSAVDTSAFLSMNGGTAARVYTLASPYLTAELDELQFAQSAASMTIVHENWTPRELVRSSDTSWSLNATTANTPEIANPTNVSATGPGAGALTYTYTVTSVDIDGEESNGSSTTLTSKVAPDVTAAVITWDDEPNAYEFNIYRKFSTQTTRLLLATVQKGYQTYTDSSAVTAGTQDTRIRALLTLAGDTAGGEPKVVGYFQDRRVYANQTAASMSIATVACSWVGHYTNFLVPATQSDSTPVGFTLVGKRVHEVRHVFDLNSFLVMTSNGIFRLDGNESGVLTSTGINPKQIAHHGVATLRPIGTGTGLIYLQDGQKIIRDLGYEIRVDGYQGNDLTAFATHLFEGYTVDDWDYQETPNSILWLKRSDGSLLSLTYVKEQQIFAWGKHDTQGTFENVCVVREGNEHTVYFVVKRTIDARTVRYVERLKSRYIDEIKDAVLMDCALTYDGRNTTSNHTMTLSGSGWTYTDELTLTSSTAYFAVTEIGNEIHLTGSDGTIIRFKITGWTSTTVVTGKPNKTVPASMQASAISSWTRAVDVVAGLWHLEGEDVSVFADGYVVGSPNNPACTVYTVTDGELELDKCYGVIHVGLPYISDLETLDVDSADTETLADKKKLVTRVTARLHESRGMWVGNHPGDDTLEGLTEAQLRSVGDGYESPVPLVSEDVTVNIEPHWNSNGRVLIRQVDPVPLTVLSISPSGLIPRR